MTERAGSERRQQVSSSGVPETMLWTLHNRASEARRPGSFLHDPECMRITIPRWFSRKTLRGYHKTRSYRAPRMPWGVNCDEIEPLLRSWSARVAQLELVPFDYAFGPTFALQRLLSRLPLLRERVATVVRVSSSGATAGPG